MQYCKHRFVLIVAKCNVNVNKMKVGEDTISVLIVAKCNVNGLSGFVSINILGINSSKV